MLLLDVLISTRENQQTISDMSGRAPDLLAIDFPAAIDLFRCCTHAAQEVGSAGRLRKRDRGFKLPRGYERQIFLLLLFAAIDSNGIGSGKCCTAPAPRETAKRTGDRQNVVEGKSEHEGLASG